MIEDFRLKIFDMAVREGSFSRAALRLGISQSAVSQCVADLEKKTGRRLFIRDRGQVRLSGDGDIFYGYVRNILSWYDAASDAFPQEMQASGKVRISASADLASGFLSEVISPLLARTDGLDISTVTDGSDADIVLKSELHAGSISWEEGECVGISPVCAFSAPSNPCSYSRDVRSLSDIHGRSLIVWTGLVTGREWSREDDISAVGLKNIHKIALRSDSAGLVIQTVRSSGTAVGLLPYYAIYRQVADGSVVRLPLVQPSSFAAVYLKVSESLADSGICRIVRQRASMLLDNGNKAF